MLIYYWQCLGAHLISAWVGASIRWFHIVSATEIIQGTLNGLIHRVAHTPTKLNPT